MGCSHSCLGGHSHEGRSITVPVLTHYPGQNTESTSIRHPATLPLANKGNQFWLIDVKILLKKNLGTSTNTRNAEESCHKPEDSTTRTAPNVSHTCEKSFATDTVFQTGTESQKLCGQPLTQPYTAGPETQRGGRVPARPCPASSNSSPGASGQKDTVHELGPRRWMCGCYQHSK